MKLLIVGLGSMGKRRARLTKGIDTAIQIVGVDTAESRRALRLHYAQLGANFVWPLLFFRAGEYAVAFWWLLFLLALVAAEMASFRRLDRTAGRLLAPYLAWLAFAAYLNYAVVRLTA